MNNKIELSKRLEAAKLIARKAGNFALNKQKNKNFVVSEKQKNDFVTTSDKETENLIYSELKKMFPNDGFLGEESDEVPGSGRWVVDPIDGTTNYFKSLPHWAVSIAYEQEENNPLLGVIYSPVFDDIYYARVGFGAFKNDKKIKVSDVSKIEYSINVCVPPHRYKKYYNQYMDNFNIIGKNCSDIRSYGSCALEICDIASGNIEGYYEMFLGYYDFAAAKIILEEAGGTFVYYKSEVEKKYNVIASNNALTKWYENNLK